MTDKRTGLAGLCAGDIMTTDVHTVAVATPLAEVLQMFTEYGIGGLPVTGETGHIVGVISVRDIVDRYAETGVPSTPGFYHQTTEELLEFGLDPDMVDADNGDLCGDVMTAEVHTVGIDEPVAVVARRMSDLRVHRLVVVDAGKTVGLVSASDIVRAVAESGG